MERSFGKKRDIYEQHFFVPREFLFLHYHMCIIFPRFFNRKYFPSGEFFHFFTARRCLWAIASKFLRFTIFLCNVFCCLKSRLICRSTVQTNHTSESVKYSRKIYLYVYLSRFCFASFVWLPIWITTSMSPICMSRILLVLVSWISRITIYTSYMICIYKGNKNKCCHSL